MSSYYSTFPSSLSSSFSFSFSSPLSFPFSFAIASSSPCTLQSLPTEIRYEIAIVSRLSQPTLVALRNTCRSWRATIDSATSMRPHRRRLLDICMAQPRALSGATVPGAQATATTPEPLIIPRVSHTRHLREVLNVSMARGSAPVGLRMAA